MSSVADSTESVFKSFHYNIETSNAIPLQQQKIIILITVYCMCVILFNMQEQQWRLPGAACEVLDPPPTAKTQTHMNTHAALRIRHDHSGFDW